MIATIHTNCKRDKNAIKIWYHLTTWFIMFNVIDDLLQFVAFVVIIQGSVSIASQ